MRAACLSLTLAVLVPPTALGQTPPPTAGDPPTFADPVLYTIDATLDRAAKGDMNNDGTIDVVVAGAKCASPCQHVTVLLNDATKWATSPSTALTVITIPIDENFAVCSSQGGCQDADVIVAQLSGDALPDIAVSMDAADNGVIFILTNDPALPGQQFTETSVSLPPHHFASGLTSADLNSDGFIDLAVSGEDKTDPNSPVAKVLTYRNDGFGAFTLDRTVEILGVTDAGDIVAGKFNNDPFKPDLAITNASDDSVSILELQPDGDYNIRQIAGPGNPSPFSFFAIAKGRTDLSNGLGQIVCSEATREHISAFRQDAQGNLFHSRVNNQDGTGDHYPVGFAGDVPRGLRIARVNGGSARDTATALQDKFLEAVAVVQLGLGNGKFERDAQGIAIRYSFNATPAARQLIAEQPNDIEVLDLNEDGLNDLVVICAGDPSDPSAAPRLISVLIQTTN